MRKIGIDMVISEEQAVIDSKRAGEAILEDALAQNTSGPVIISNSFAAKNFVASNFAELAGKVKYYPSVQDSFATIVKNHADKSEVKERYKTVVFTAGNENGAKAREEGTVDFSMNEREIYRIFLRTGVNLKRIVPQDGLKFETEPEFIYGRVTGPLEFSYRKDPEVFTVDGKRVAIARNLGQSRRLLEEVIAGSCKYDIIRLSA